MLPVQLTVKALDDDKRIITGIASTPTPDRMGDVVEPMGAKFKLPLPLIFHHNHQAPIGQVVEAKATPEGIRFKATIARIEEPGTLKDRVDEAWQSIREGLTRAVSIGFRALSDEPIRGGGRRFVAWEFLELSLVTIPANSDARIESFHGKSATPDDPIMKRLNRINAEIHERMEAEAAEAIAADRKPQKFTAGLLGALVGGQLIVLQELLRETGRLEKKIAELEGRKTMNYRRTFEAGQKYDVGDALTHRGSLWWCCSPTSEPPGESDQWQLAVKKGRDGTRGARNDE